MLFKAIVALNEKMDGLATKEELQDVRLHMATTKHIEAIKDEFEYLGDEVDTLKMQSATREDVRAIVGEAKDEVLEEIRPISKAQDTDSMTLINYGHRFTRVEKPLSLN
jgi:hypothetical protein